MSELENNNSTTSFCKSSNNQLNKVNKVSDYLKESYHELVDKVTWPNSEQLQQSTVIVLVATAVITAIVGLMDLASSWLLKLIYSLFQ